MTTPRRQSDQVFIIGMILSMTCWGFSWTSGKILSQYGDPLTISLIRFGVTVLSLIAVVLVLKEKLQLKRAGFFDLLIAGMLLSIYTYVFFKGLMLGKAGAGGVLVTVLNPIVAYAITIILARRKPTRREMLGLSLGLVAGFVLLKVFSSPGDIIKAGNIYFLLAAIVWAVLSRYTARASRYGSSISFSFWLYVVSTLMMSFLAGVNPSIHVLKNADSLFWWNLFFSATITTALATTFYFVATARVGASQASSFIFLVPFSAALGSWTFLCETIELHTIIGGLLGIAAVYVLNLRKR
ncbi:MAG TPA: DMT family transporter [Chryseosolibacter sp.]|nr:DMT family transporter [Chryseosolibacter sp.]